MTGPYLQTEKTAINACARPHGQAKTSSLPAEKSAIRDPQSAMEEPDFNEATIKVLEETAFKLSLQCSEPEEELNPTSETQRPEMPPKDGGKSSLSISEFALKALNQITVMLARYRNVSVRERMAKVQEGKLQLHREQFEWKKAVQAAKAESKSALHSPNSAIPEDSLGRLAKTLDDVERRACEKFNLPCSAPSADQSSSNNADDARGPYLQTEKNANRKADSGLGGQPSEIQAHTASSPHPAMTGPYLQTEKICPAKPLRSLLLKNLQSAI